MTITAQLGQPIVLTAVVVRYGRRVSGKALTVDVVKASDGSSVLAATTLVEGSEPGVYSFVWTTPPFEQSRFIATYRYGLRRWSEDVEIVDRTELTLTATAAAIEGEIVRISSVEGEVVAPAAVESEVATIAAVESEVAQPSAAEAEVATPQAVEGEVDAD